MREQGESTRVYFLGVPAGKRENTIMYSDISGDGKPAPWHQLFDSGAKSTSDTPLSKVRATVVRQL